MGGGGGGAGGNTTDFLDTGINKKNKTSVKGCKNYWVL